MKKRILSILLLCCMVLTLLPTTASAAETGAMDNIPAKFDVEIDLCGRTSDINIKYLFVLKRSGLCLDQEDSDQRKEGGAAHFSGQR